VIKINEYEKKEYLHTNYNSSININHAGPARSTYFKIRNKIVLMMVRIASTSIA